MSTFKLADYGDVPVELPDGLTKDRLLGFHPFNNWIKTLHNSLSLQRTVTSHPFHPDPYTLRSIKIQAYDMFGSSRLGFLKLQSTITNAAGESLPGAVFLRGPAVAMLVILRPDDDVPGKEERHVLFTVQARIAAGSLAFVELPAGMVDDEGAFAGTAAKEIKEELGMEIREKELISLTDLAFSTAPKKEGKEELDEGLPQATYPSVGGCDEYIPIYMAEKRVPRAQLGVWTGKLTGLRDEGEKITLKLVKMEDAWREGARDAKCLSALALWEVLRREGKLG